MQFVSPLLLREAELAATARMAFRSMREGKRRKMKMTVVRRRRRSRGNDSMPGYHVLKRHELKRKKSVKQLLFLMLHVNQDDSTFCLRSLSRGGLEGQSLPI